VPIRTTIARLALLCAVLPSIALAACGSNEEDELIAVDVWVRSLCSAAASFDTASDEAGETFIESDLEDTAEAKEAFAESIALQREAQKDFRDEFDELGKPDVEDPDAVIEAFREQFDENDELSGNIADEVANIDDDDDFVEAFFALEFEEPDFRAKLEPLAEDDAGVQDIIDEVEANPDCAVTLFNADEDVEPDPEPTVEQTATPSAIEVTPGPTVAANPANEAWAAGVCGSLLDWVLDLEDANLDLQGEADAASSAEDLKQVLVRFLEQGLSDTEDFAFDMFFLDPPDVADGEAIHEVFIVVSEDLVFLFEDFVDEANAIDASSLSSVATDMEEFELRVGGAFEEIGAAFDELDQYDPEGLDALFATLPDCVALSQ
jgi:hypothetical protein